MRYIKPYDASHIPDHILQDIKDLYIDFRDEFGFLEHRQGENLNGYYSTFKFEKSFVTRIVMTFTTNSQFSPKYESKEDKRFGDKIRIELEKLSKRINDIGLVTNIYTDGQDIRCGYILEAY